MIFVECLEHFSESFSLLFVQKLASNIAHSCLFEDLVGLVALEVVEHRSGMNLVKLWTRDDFEPRMVQGHGSRRTVSVI